MGRCFEDNEKKLIIKFSNGLLVFPGKLNSFKWYQSVTIEICRLTMKFNSTGLTFRMAVRRKDNEPGVANATD